MYISVAKSRKSTTLEQKKMLWSELCDRLSRTKRTKETLAQFLQMSSEEQTAIKDVGGFVGGSLTDGRRLKSNVGMRYVVTLDMDFGVPGICEKLELENKYACCIYSTHKHTPEKPRLRLVYLLSKAVMRKDYETVARGVAEEIGLQYFDVTTFQAERLMFYPSTARDGIFYYKVLEGEAVNPDVYLRRAQERFVDEVSAKQFLGVELTEQEQSVVKDMTPNAYLAGLKAKQGDPLTKEGIVGAFCRTYTCTQVLDKFLVGVYERTADPMRYNYIAGEGGPGVVVYDNDRFVYSFHATDKLSYKLMNAFDLVKRYKFGDNGVKSHRAMERFALEDPAVKERYEKEQDEAVRKKGKEKLTKHLAELVEGPVPETSTAWLDLLDYTKSGDIVNSLKNLVTILAHDVNLVNIAYNEQFGSLWIRGDVPWKRVEEGFAESDFASLKHYYSKYYDLECNDKLYDAVWTVVKDRVFNPIKEYFDGLPTWDGVERVPTLLVDYLGAADNEYTRQVTTKMLVAAVARVYEPGCKFEYVLILNGPQGCGKSTFFKKLAKDWFSDNLSFSDMKDKTAAEKVARYWIIEMAELEGINKAAWEAVKAFVSRQDDTYRGVYEKAVTSHKRRCILVGTTNQESFLRDTTGNRRFWPVDCCKPLGRNVWDLKDADIDQIWAEVLVLYKQGVDLWLDSKVENLAQEQQQKALVNDTRLDSFKEYLDMYVPVYEWDEMSIAQRRSYLEKWFANPYPESTEGLYQRQEICYNEIFSEFFGKDHKDKNTDEKRAVKQMMAALPEWRWHGDDKKTFHHFKQQRYFKREGK